MIVTSCVGLLATVHYGNWKCLNCYLTVISIYTLMNISKYFYAWRYCTHGTKMIVKENTYLWLTLLMGLSRDSLMETRKTMKVKHCNVNYNRKWESIMLWYVWFCYLENAYHMYVIYVSCQCKFCGTMMRVKYRFMVYINVSFVNDNVHMVHYVNHCGKECSKIILHSR